MREDLSTRKTKTNPSFKYELSEEQKLAKEKILDSKIAIITGKAGTSKTFLDVYSSPTGLYRGYGLPSR